jgi:hypothetical protein
MEHLPFKSVTIYCFCCENPIKKKANLFCRKGEEFDADHCFCSGCYKKFKGGCITFNGTSVSKKNLEKKKNDEVFFEPVSFNTVYYIIQFDIENFKLTLYDCCFF